MSNHYQSIPDRSRAGLPTTASGVAQQSTCENYATAKHSENKSRKKGERRVKKQRKSVERKTLTYKGELMENKMG